MSDFRYRVPFVPWRYVKRHTAYLHECIYDLQAKCWDSDHESAWETFGRIDMDCASEGWGEMEAKMICDTHNCILKKENP